jgi:signal transduction histidine kinase
VPDTGWWRRRAVAAVASVRARAALGATVVVAVALVAAGVLMLLTLRDNLDEQADTRAELSASEVAAQLATGTAFEDLRLGDEEPVQVLDGGGRVRAVSDDLDAITGTPSGDVVPWRPSGESQDRQPQQPEQPQQRPGAGDDEGDDDDDDSDSGSDDDDEASDQASDDDETVQEDDEDAVLGPGDVEQDPDFSDGTARIDGRAGEYRFASVAAVTPHDVRVTVYAGAPLDAEQAAVDSVRTSMLVGLPLLLAVVAGVTWLVTRRALRPVEGIRREMAAITRSEDLSRRVPQPDSRDEIGRLATTTNETLAALEASVARQRRFVADASHELRSPIASLRTQLEVGEAHPELLDLPGAVTDTVRLQDLAADLLLLARLDAGERPLTGSVDLTRLVADEVARRGVRASEMAEVTVSGSRGQLGRVLGNLLDNAQRHAASAVRVSVRREGDEAVVEVADDGAGVPEPDRERIFERFVRLDDARSRDEGGAGLGLAIARDVATRHGGTLTAAAAPEGGALFTLRLPTTEG